jgi:hypothetical protein
MSVSDGERIMDTQTTAPSSIDELEAELRDIRESILTATNYAKQNDRAFTVAIIDDAVTRLSAILGE